MNRILVAGATSAIAQAIVRRRVDVAEAPGELHLVLAGRDAARVEAVAADLRVRGAGRAEAVGVDFDDIGAHQGLLDEARARLGTVDLILVAWGHLPDQAAAERDPELAQAAWHTNATATVAFLGRAASLLEAQGEGRLAVITSVAGDRGRRSNYVYGSAKAAVIAYLSGLRARLHPLGIRVVDLRPGPVDTPMTADLRKGPLFVSAERAGRLAWSAIDRGRDVAYVPGYWRFIMAGVRAVPEGIFKRMKLKA